MDVENTVNIHGKVSKHTLPYIFRYFAIYVNILFLEAAPLLGDKHHD